MTERSPESIMRRSTWRSRIYVENPDFGINTPWIFFLKAVRKVLEDMPERMWNLERDTVGRPDLLPDSVDSDNEMGPEDQ